VSRLALLIALLGGSQSGPMDDGSSEFDPTAFADSGVCLEGATVDDFETCFAATDPTADRTVTFQNVSGTVYVTSGTDVALTDGGTNATLTAVNGAVCYSTASALALSAAGTSGQVF